MTIQSESANEQYHQYNVWENCCEIYHLQIKKIPLFLVIPLKLSTHLYYIELYFY